MGQLNLAANYIQKGGTVFQGVVDAPGGSNGVFTAIVTETPDGEIGVVQRGGVIK